MKRIDGLTYEEVKYNVYAFGADMKRFARKRDAARLDHTRAKWQKKYASAAGYLANNQERLARFEAVEHGVQSDEATCTDCGAPLGEDGNCTGVDRVLESLRR